jgi:hypothetical protein
MFLVRMILLTIILSILLGCVNREGAGYQPYYAYHSEDSIIYSSNYGGTDYGAYSGEAASTVIAPDTYHLGSYRAPVRAKESDKSWVSSQNPQNYTIELADDANASYVAKRLSQAPLRNRRAELKYNKEGQSYYKGVYGSYSSAEEAQKALEELPAEIKQGASVQQWNRVQSNLQE